MQSEIELIIPYGATLNQRIIDSAISGTGNMKAQQIGVFWTIYFLTRNGDYITAKSISELMWIAPSVMSEILSSLTDLDLLTRQKSSSTTGPGRKAYEYRTKLPEDVAVKIINSYLEKNRKP